MEPKRQLEELLEIKMNLYGFFLFLEKALSQENAFVLRRLLVFKV